MGPKIIDRGPAAMDTRQCEVGFDYHCGSRGGVAIGCLRNDARWGFSKRVKRMTDNLPFSIRHGGAPLPPQLALGELSHSARNLLWFMLHETMIMYVNDLKYSGAYMTGGWATATEIIWVRFLQKGIDDYVNEFHSIKKAFKKIIYEEEVNEVFDFIEFILSLDCLEDDNLGALFKGVLEKEKTAYTIIDNKLVSPITSEPLSNSIIDGLNASKDRGWLNAETHLIDALHELRSGNWKGSVHQSMSAVEGISRKLTKEKDISKALRKLSKNGVIAPTLDAAFNKLYNWTSATEGVRHSLVNNQESEVDEAEAIFMLGVCASFVAFAARRWPRDEGDDAAP